MGFSFLVCMYMGKIIIMFSSLIYKDSWDWVCKEEKNENDKNMSDWDFEKYNYKLNLIVKLN